MIYLIGGPPKCGKTTLAKKLAKKLGIQWVASDTLEVVAMNYVWKYAPKKFDGLYPHRAMKGETNDETYALFSPKKIAKGYVCSLFLKSCDLFVAELFNERACQSEPAL